MIREYGRSYCDRAPAGRPTRLTTTQTCDRMDAESVDVRCVRCMALNMVDARSDLTRCTQCRYVWRWREPVYPLRGTTR